MGRIALVLLILFSALTQVPAQQPYSLIVKGGHVIDPKSGLNERMDIAITDGKIAVLAKNIDAKLGMQVVNATGYYVTPGIIDMHTHNFFGTEPGNYLRNSYYALAPDTYSFRNGITTVVDAGSPGWRSFATFKDQTIDRSHTRVLAFLNIVGEGMRGGVYEQDTSDMDINMAALTARQHREHIVGFKVAHYVGHEWTPVDHAVEAGKFAGNIPVMVDFGEADPPLSLEELFMKHLRPGDIYTHAFGGGGGRESIVDTVAKKLRPFVPEARKRGIIFDVGYGGASFSYAQAIPATKAGFFPDVISTDLHGGSMNTSMKDLLSVMSKFLAMGMDLKSVITAVTWKPAQVIHREELGNIAVGGIADLSVLNIRSGTFGMYDRWGYRMEGKQKFECEATILAGQVMYDLDGISRPLVFPYRGARK